MMINKMESFMFERVIPVLITIVTLCVVYLVICVLPAHLLAEQECLKNGYPETHTTMLLQSYCAKPGEELLFI